jgi:RES domain-containing protein
VFVPLSGTFYRISFAKYAQSVLSGVLHPEGRFHHHMQPALYASPSEASAAIAIDIYVKGGDEPRVIIPLQVSSARMADLRDARTCDALGIDPRWPSVPWADERAAGLPATSWKAADIVRKTAADGMIYASRRVPSRWHIVLFRWNHPGHAQVSAQGDARPWSQISRDHIS